MQRTQWLEQRRQEIWGSDAIKAILQRRKEITKEITAVLSLIQRLQALTREEEELNTIIMTSLEASEKPAQPIPSGPDNVGKGTADIGLEVAPSTEGLPKHAESYQKVTVCLFDRHVLFLDKVALAIQEKTGKHVKRAELVRSIVDHAAAWVRPDKPDADFDKAVRSLLPGLEGGKT